MDESSPALPSDLNGSQHALSTTYQQADDNLLATQQLLRATLDSSMDMIQVFVAVRNPQGEIVDFTWVLNNHAAQKIYGDVVGKSLLHLQPGVVEEGIFAVFTDVVQTGLPQHYEKHYVHEPFDGWFHQSVVKLNDGVATITADITARKRAEQQLQQSNELLQQVIDAPSIGIALYKAIRDEQGHITDFVHESINRASLQMLGGEEFTGRPFSDHGENAHQQMPQLIDAIETATANRYVRQASLLGHTCWFAITNTPVVGDRLVHTWEDVTERVRAEREILRLKEEVAQKAEDKYHAIFNAIDEGFCIQELMYDDRGQLVDLRTTEANLACERQTGFTKDVIGRWHSEFGLTTDRVWFDSYDRVAKTGEPETVEAWHELSGRWYQASLSRIGEAGSRQLAVVFNDITERKRQEEQQAYRLTLSEALRSIADPIEIEETVTRLARQQFGADRCYYCRIEAGQAIITRDARQSDLPSVAGTYPLSSFALLKSVVDAGQPFVVDDAATTPILDAAIRAICLQLQVISFMDVPVIKNGQAVGVLCVVQATPRHWSQTEVQLASDTAERIWAAVERARAEEALRRSEEQLQKALSIQTVGVIFFNQQTIIRDANEAFLRMSGVSQSAIDQQLTSLIDLTLPPWRPLCQQAMAELTTLGRSLPHEKGLLRADGSQWWGLFAGSRLSEDEFVEFVIDVTERRGAEDALRLADRRKDEFLAMLAHELRNPMSTLRSGLQILRLVDTSDELSSQTVEMMNRQTDHLVRMVDDLLDVSRISRGKIELKAERVNLVDVVSQAVESAQTLYREQEKRLQLALPTDPIYLEGDATRLSQVVANLLTNGARYTGDRGQVWVRLSHQRQQAILQVRDNGIGLAADQLSAIFELFVQVDNSTARSKGGLGLGLTLVKRLVEMHGGRVEAQSEGIGQGSTFTVHLPTLVAAAEPTPTASPQATNPAAVKRILVIDDNTDAGFTLGMLLKLKGYEAHTRTSGRAGIEAAERLQSWAILLDIGMPGMNGYETCRAIRQQAWGQDMVIIALTGYGQEEDRRRTSEAGFNGHLVKPVDVVALTKMLTDLLSNDQDNVELA